MSRLGNRVTALESKSPAGLAGVWHRLIWRASQPSVELLAGYGEDSVAPNDNIMLIRIVSAAEGRPASDKIRDRDQPIADAWLGLRKDK
jgi:hypothetical protein